VPFDRSKTNRSIAWAEGPASHLRFPLTHNPICNPPLIRSTPEFVTSRPRFYPSWDSPTLYRSSHLRESLLVSTCMGRPPACRVSLSSTNDKIFQIMMIRVMNQLHLGGLFNRPIFFTAFHFEPIGHLHTIYSRNGNYDSQLSFGLALPKSRRK